MRTRLGVFLLMFITFLWGTTFVVLKLGLENASPSLITASRFIVAAAVFLPFLAGHFRRSSARMWLVGVELGFWLALGYATQTFGLQYTSVGHSAFLNALHVVIVPVIYAAAQHRVRPLTWFCALTALAGTGLLCGEKASLNVGDLWTIASAAAWAVYIVRLGMFSARWPVLPLTAVQLLAVCLCCLLWAILDGQAAGAVLAAVPWKTWALILYLGLIATAIPTIIQTFAQRYVIAPQAAVIFTMEPVWAVVFAFLIFHQMLGFVGIIGAALITAAALLSQWRAPQAPLPPQPSTQPS